MTDSTEVNLVVQRQPCPISDLRGGDTASYDLRRTASQHGNGSGQRTKAAGGTCAQKLEKDNFTADDVPSLLKRYAENYKEQRMAYYSAASIYHSINRFDP